MTKPTRALLYYIRRYLAAHPEKKKNLRALYQKETGGPLIHSTLWRHTRFKAEPLMSDSLVYLIFLHREKAIVFGRKPADPLFTYAHPELLRAAKP